MTERHCTRCNKLLPNDPHRRIYSSWSRSYYCADLDACKARARRKAKLGGRA